MNEEASYEKIFESLEKSNISEELTELIKRSKLSRRARIVIKHILEHGSITTEDLESKYGYKHPPRAAGDVRDAGIPLESINVKSSDGLNITEYTFGDLTQIQEDKLGGRKIFSKKFRDRLREIHDDKCAICSGHFEPRYMQIDHRIPYRISGEKKDSKRDVQDYMLVCRSCNRAKSWSCEHCCNWSAERLPKICSKCYWANPEDYTHVALREIRRLDILWDESDIQTYERLRTEALKDEHTIPDYVKKIIEEHLEC